VLEAHDGIGVRWVDERRFELAAPERCFAKVALRLALHIARRTASSATRCNGSDPDRVRQPAAQECEHAQCPTVRSYAQYEQPPSPQSLSFVHSSLHEWQ
jgi:hypothetical protein